MQQLYGGMSMRYIFATILFVFTIIAFFYATRILYNKNFKTKTFILLTFLSIASALWGLGYGITLISSSESLSFIFTLISLLGFILFIIANQTTICIFQKTKSALKTLCTLLAVELSTGIILFCVLSTKTNHQFSYTNNELHISFSPLANIILSIYIIGIVVALLVMSINLLSKKYSKRFNALGKAILVVIGLIVIGVISDILISIIEPSYNLSICTLLQFVGLEIMYHALHKFGQNAIRLENVANYIFDNYDVPFFVFDDKHSLKFMNNSAINNVGSNCNVGDNEKDVWENIFHQSVPEDINEKCCELPLVLETSNETKHFILTTNPFFNEYEDFIGYIVTATNITSQIESAKHEEAAAIKTQFLANMSHEIRTPLNSILGFNDAIIQNPADTNKVKVYSNNIHEAGENLKDIINSILDISKIEMGQLEIVSKEYNFVELLDNLVSMFELLSSKKGLEFNTKIDSSLPQWMIGDERHLRQVLTNILSNAVKYTDKGSITLEIKVLDKKPPLNNILFAVTDTGKGIKEEDQAKLYEKFQRLDTEHFKHVEGSGLGMSIVQMTLKAMNSKIQLNSTYNEGSTFYFELEQLSMKEETIGNFQIRRQENANKEFQSINFRAPEAKILIVDDVEMNIDATIALLEFTNMNLDKALSGKEAIDKIKQEKYDIIFMDHMMPDLDGIETTKAIRNLSIEYNDAYYASVPIVALTANAIVGMKEMYQNASMQDFISKPIEISSIISVIKRWLPEDKIMEASEEELKTAALAKSGHLDSSEIVMPDAWPTDIKDIDITLAKKYNANPIGLEKNMKSFVNAYEKNKQDISSFFESNDIKNYVIKVHGLKSTSKMIGAIELSDKAKHNEDMGNQNVMTQEDFDELMSLYDTCVSNIKEYYDIDDFNTLPSINEAEYNNILAEIKSAADTFDATKFMELEERISNLSVPPNYQTKFDEIKQLVSNLSFTKVSEMIN